VATAPATRPRARAPRGGLRAVAEARARTLFGKSPALPVALIATAVFVWLASHEGGFLATTFLPTALLMLALVVVSLVALPKPNARPASLAAVALLASYAAFSYLSILWAAQKGIAWDGANRTVLYALVLALFALWRIDGSTAAAVLGVYALGVAAVGLVELLRAAASTNPLAFFHEGRLSEPTGYANANVALWFTAFWPCLVLSARREVHPALRGLLMGGAGLLAALAILGQSRSWMAVLPLMVVTVLVAVPGRGRTIAAIVLVGGAAVAMLEPLNAAYAGFDGKTAPSEYFADGARTAIITSTVLLAVGALWGVVDRRLHVSPGTARRTSVAIVLAFVLACLGGLAAFTVAKGSPVSVASDVWREFKKGGTEPSFHGTRLGLAAGNYRYDYFRVGWENFTEHPIAGVGVDNYGHQYLRRGKSGQTPSYPHSIELRVLSMTGLVGLLLFGGAIVAALMAATSAVRRSRGLGGVAAGTGIVMFAYFMLHGSLDWLWEFPALGCAGFAALGLAGAVGPSTRSRLRLPARAPVATAGAALTLTLAVGITLPWLAERELSRAKEIAASDPVAALERLDRASHLNGLSPVAETTAAVVEARRDRLGDARRHFETALERDPGDPFSYLQLAAIASSEDRRDDALRLARRARALSPLDEVGRRVELDLRRGRYVSPERVNRLILRDIDRRIGPG
jgi:O-antigen ligase